MRGGEKVLLSLLRLFPGAPVYTLLQDHFIKLREKLEWGPLVPYNIVGQLNQHPRAAMAMLASPDRDKYVDFYDKCVGDV